VILNGFGRFLRVKEGWDDILLAIPSKAGEGVDARTGIHWPWGNVVEADAARLKLLANATAGH
jgi:hypothetical protein